MTYAATLLNTVQTILANNADIAKWYAEEHGVTAADLNITNIMVSGTGGYADIVGMILSDAGVDVE